MHDSLDLLVIYDKTTVLEFCCHSSYIVSLFVFVEYQCNFVYQGLIFIIDVSLTYFKVIDGSWESCGLQKIGQSIFFLIDEFFDDTCFLALPEDAIFSIAMAFIFLSRHSPLLDIHFFFSIALILRALV